MYTVGGIEKAQIEKAEEYKDLLGLDMDQTIQLFRVYKWNIDKLMEAWLQNQDKVKVQVGFLPDKTLLKQFPYLDQSTAKNNGGYCLICYS